METRHKNSCAVGQQFSLDPPTNDLVGRRFQWNLTERAL
jgi:hypothetical protein